MQHEYDVDEDAYDMDDGEEAYEGLDAYLGGEQDEDSDDDDYVPSHADRGGVDDDDDDDEEEEDEDEDIDHQLDVEDVAEAMEDLVGLAETESSGRMSVAQLLENFLSTSGAVSVTPDGNELHISGLSAGNLDRVLALLRTTVGNVQIVPVQSSRTSGSGQRNQADEEEEEEEEEQQPRASRRNLPRNRGRGRDKTPDWWKKAYSEPQQVGQELLMSGEFGNILPKLRNYRMNGRSQNIARLLRERMTRTRPLPKEDLIEPLVPNSHGTVVASYPSNVYCGQFSNDSSFYYVCCKDFNMHIYDMTAPRATMNRPGALYHDPTTGHRTTMKVHKSIRGIADGWTVTDSHLSPDNERMIYSSMGASVYMVKTLDYDATQTPVSFSDTGSRRGRATWGWDENDDYYIWSCRFSADGNEIIAGGRGSIYVYDLLAAKRTVKIRAHHDDVNSCCWADSGSNVLISASDDTFIKVWDRRSLGSSPKPSGVLIGHTEGITNVSAKGDGRYVISNGKDQALRLWDLRKMRTNEEHEAVQRVGNTYGLPDFDYRYADDRKQRYAAHPKDCSIMAYRGHTVMRTLIRCHFSPIESTGGSYIYSGSTDGKVHIWSLDGRIVQVLDRSKTLPISFDPSAPDPKELTQRKSYNCVRDVSWHSREPVLLSAAWGDHNSTVARHEWKGLNKMNYNLEDWVEKREAESLETPSMRPHRRGIPGAFNNGEDISDSEL